MSAESIDEASDSVSRWWRSGSSCIHDHFCNYTYTQILEVHGNSIESVIAIAIAILSEPLQRTGFAAPQSLAKALSDAGIPLRPRRRLLQTTGSSKHRGNGGPVASRPSRHLRRAYGCAPAASGQKRTDCQHA